MLAVEDGESEPSMAIKILATRVTSPKILCATGSPLLRMLLSSMSSSNKLGNRRVREILFKFFKNICYGAFDKC